MAWSVEETPAELLVEVREIRNSWFSRLNDDHRTLLVATSGALTLAGAALLTWGVTAYPQPTFLWSFVGHYIRGVVGWSFVALGVALAWRTGAYSGKGTFAQYYLAFLAILLGMIAGILWGQMSLRPEGMSGSPAADIAYLDHLLSRAQTAWPLVGGVLPWAALGFQAFGFGIASKLSDLLAQGSKKSKDV